MPNPLRSEADAFRLLMIIVAGAVAVIAVALLAGSVAGVVLAAGLVGFGLGVSWRTIREALGSGPEAEASSRSPAQRPRPGSRPGP